MRAAVLDVGGTAIKSGVWEDGRLLEAAEDATDAAQGGSHLLECMVRILHRLDAGQADAIGISTTGQVNVDTGEIYYANDNIPGYTGVRVGERIRREFHVPVAVENDVNAAALGEYYAGAAKGKKDFLCLTYGTGVGGAIVLDGKIYEGHRWAAASFGGILTHPEQREPGKQLSGCYEACASTAALVRKVREIDPVLTDGRKIFEAIGQPRVKAAVDAWIDEITYGLITLIHIFDVPAVVLGGGVMAQNYVLEEVRRKTLERVEENFTETEILGAGLGNRAGLMGAAYLARKKAVGLEFRL